MTPLHDHECLLHEVVTYVLLALIKKFIQSRPPGRRLVTSDIQVIKMKDDIIEGDDDDGDGDGDCGHDYLEDA